MTTRLKIYNGCLTEHLGERQLSSLSEARAPRRILDTIWNDGFTDLVLEQGYWNFAMRSSQIDYDSDVTPGFGLQRAFSIPTDHIRTAAVCEDEFFEFPLLRYKEEQDYWFSDLDTIYVSYVSNDGDYGGDLSKWPQSVVDFSKCFLAFKACQRITQSDEKTEYLRKLSNKLKIDARSKDAMADPTSFPPTGSWVNSRRSGRQAKRNSSGSWSF